MLTPRGVATAEILAQTSASNTLSGTTRLRQSDRRAIQRLTRTDQFRAFTPSAPAPSIREAATTVGLLPDTPPAALQRRLISLASSARAAQRDDVERFTEWLMLALNNSPSK